MMDEHLLNILAVHLLEVFLLSLGFQPSGDWDENDPNCRREYGPHVVWTISACVPHDTDVESLKMHFQEFLSHHNAAITAVKFESYDITAYDCSHCGGKHINVSIYQ